MKKYIHSIYTKEAHFNDEFESFCYENCIKNILDARGIENSLLYINSSLSILFDKNIGITTHCNLRGLLPTVNDAIHKSYYNKVDSMEVFFQNINYLFKKKEPLIVGVDTYYLRYASNYQKNHAAHELILCGADLDRQVVYVIDWYKPWFFRGAVAIEEFLQARESLNEYDGSIYSGKAILNRWTYISDFDVMPPAILLRENISLTNKQFYDDKLIFNKVFSYLLNSHDLIFWRRAYAQLFIVFKRIVLFVYCLNQYNIYLKSNLIKKYIESMNDYIDIWKILLSIILRQSVGRTNSINNSMERIAIAIINQNTINKGFTDKILEEIK